MPPAAGVGWPCDDALREHVARVGGEPRARAVDQRVLADATGADDEQTPAMGGRSGLVQADVHRGADCCGRLVEM